MQKNHHSFWEKIELVPFKTVVRDEHAQVCIVGSGISGLTIAYQLLKYGHSVIVLDKEAEIGGESVLTSAHLTSALDDRYYHLANLLSENELKTAAHSHTMAIQKIEEIIREEKIDCDFKRLSGYLLPGEDDEDEVLDKERLAATMAGLKSLKIRKEIPHLNCNSSALEFPNQAVFHPLKYLRGLQAAVERMGGQIFGNCLITGHEREEDKIIIHANNHTLSCYDIVYATNVPTHHLVSVHTKEAAYRSYMIAIRIAKNIFPDILLWDNSKPYHYVRKVEEELFDVLLVGGEDHRVGQKIVDHDPYQQLLSWTEKKLGIVGELMFSWSGQIIETLDGLGYIGKCANNSEHVYECSGDSGHGLTHGTIAGVIIPCLIMKHEENDWTRLYSPSRLNFHAFATYVKENVHGAVQNIDWLKSGECSSEKEISEGEGAVIHHKAGKIAAYKDENGKVHYCSAVCPHLGALVRWNKDEKTWDCPFHGSRFAATGEVVNGPAHNNLKKMSIEEEDELVPLNVNLADT